MAEKLSDKFRKSIEDSDFTDDRLADLYEAVEGMSDTDFKEYMYANRAYFDQNMSAAVQDIPGFRDLISVEPDYGTKPIDYKAVTGSYDALDRFNDYTMKDMEAFGSKVGMTGKEFLHRMAQDKIKQDRERISMGIGVTSDFPGLRNLPEGVQKGLAVLGGAGLNLLSPRVQEAIARGEEPKSRDYVLDATQNALYSTPFGKLKPVIKSVPLFTEGKLGARAWRSILSDGALSKALGKTESLLGGIENKAGDLVTKGLNTSLKVGANSINPIATELLDASVYDEDLPRSEASLGDIVTGTGVNWVAGKKLGPLIEKKLPNAGAPLTEWLTNTAGDKVYGDRKVAANLRIIPGSGMFLNKAQLFFDQMNEESEQKKAREKNEKKYKGKTTRAMLKGDKEDEE